MEAGGKRWKGPDPAVSSDQQAIQPSECIGAGQAGAAETDGARSAGRAAGGARSLGEADGADREADRGRAYGAKGKADGPQRNIVALIEAIESASLSDKRALRLNPSG